MTKKNPKIRVPAVAQWVQDPPCHSCSSDSVPGLGISICQKRKKEEKWIKPKKHCKEKRAHDHCISLQDCYNKVPLSASKQQEFILSQIWRLETQDPGVGRATPPLNALGEDPFLPLPVSIDSWQSSTVLQCFSLSSHSLLPVFMPLGPKSPSSCKGTSHWHRACSTESNVASP